MTKKYFDGVVPAIVDTDAVDNELTAEVANAKAKSYELMETYRIADALEAIFAMLRRANKYIDETTPWTLAKNEETRGRLSTVIYNLLETIRTAAVLLTPFIPTTADSIFAQLGTDKRDYDSIAVFGALESGKSVGDPAVLFARLDEEKILADVAAKREAAMAAEKKIEKPEGVAQIGIDTFMGVELRTAQVVACEKLPKAKKLLKLQLDLGYETRQVLSGIAKFYTPEELVGKKVIVVANLAPAKLCGEDSFGMILASGEEQVRVVFLDPETPLGERVR